MSTVIDGSAGITTNAGGSVNPSTNVEGINYSCRAWVNFNGTGTVVIRGSGNVTSITDNGTGDYTVNFTTALADANYATVCTANELSPGAQTVSSGPVAVTTATVRINVTNNATTSLLDRNSVNVSIFR